MKATNKLSVQVVTAMAYTDAVLDILYRMYDKSDPAKRGTDEFISHSASVLGLKEECIREELDSAKWKEDEAEYEALGKIYTGEYLFYRRFLRDIAPHYIGLRMDMDYINFSKTLDAVSEETRKRAYDELIQVPDRTEGEENFCRVYTAGLIAEAIKEKEAAYCKLVERGKTPEEAAKTIGESLKKMQTYLNFDDDDDIAAYATKKTYEHIDSKTHRLSDFFDEIDF